jgi:photosystem II stability/assembly factor-like uncharacterized protein
MTDEIDLLRRFRQDTPGPGEAAWERARTAITQASQASQASQATSARRAVTRRGDRRWRPPGRRVTITATVAIIVGAAAGLLAVTMQGPPDLSQPMTTAWQPARPLPSSGTEVQGPAGTWRLASYLIPRGWQENMAGPEPGPLTCPTTTTCYVEGDSATSPSGPADMDSFYVSTDGAQAWSVLPVPAHVTFTSPLSCATETGCAAGGLYYGHQPVYLTTENGGHSWTVVPLPGGTGTIYQLDCAASGTCRGLASAAGMESGGQLIKDARLITIRGGQASTTPFPAGVSVQDVSCPAGTECVAAGISVTGLASGTGPVVLVTHDGGASWRHSALPAAFDLAPYPEQVTCVDAAHCRMLGFTGDLNRNVTVTLHEDGPQTEQVQDAYSVIGFSDDGGMTWRASAFPKAIPFPQMYYLACPTTTTCYAAGSALIPIHLGAQPDTGWNEDSPVVAVTHDGGRTWQRVSFTVPAGANAAGSLQSQSFIAIGTIQCPRADACIAIGVSAQGSTNTPIYTMNSSP